MLIIEDKDDFSSQASQASRPHLIERTFYKLYNSYIYFSTSHNQLLLLLMFIEYLQVTALIFCSLGSKLFHDAVLYSWLETISDGLLIFPFLPTSRLIYLITLCIALGFIGILGLLCICSCFAKRYPSLRLTLFQLIFYLSALISGILFVPLIGVAAFSLRCNETQPGLWTLSMDSSIQCFSNEHLPLAVISLVIIPALFIIGFLYKLYMFSYALSSNAPDSKLGPTFDVAFHTARAIATIFIFIAPKESSWVVEGVIEVIMVWAIFFFEQNWSSYYYLFTKNMVRVVTSINAWIGVLIVVIKAYGQFGSVIFGATFLCGIVITWLIVLNSSFRELAFLGQKYNETHRKELYGILAIIRLKDKVSKKDRRIDYLISSYLETHTQYCPHRSCMVKKLHEKDKLLIISNRTEVMEAFMSTINIRFKKNLILDKKSATLRLLYTGFLYNYTKNYILAWEVNEGLKECKTSVNERVHSYYYRKKLEALITGKTSKTAHRLEPLEMELREKNAKKIHSLIKQSAIAYGQFWDSLQERAPLFDRFITLGFAILKYNKQIKKIWRKLASSKGRVPLNLVYVHAAYCEDILQDTARVSSIKEYMDHPELLIQDDLIQQYMGPGNGVLGVSANKKNLQLIKHVNAAFCEMVGYTREELRTMKLPVLIPKIYQELHNTAFLEMCGMVEGGNEVKEFVKECFLVHKSQYVVPVVIQIVASPNYTNNYCFIARVRRSKLGMKFEIVHLITNKDHILVNASPNALTLFNISMDMIKFAGLEISQIVPEMTKIQERTPKQVAIYTPTLEESRRFSIITHCASPDKNRRLELTGWTYNITCEWRSLKKKGGKVLGYHYMLIQDSPELEHYEVPTFYDVMNPTYQFSYNFKYNAFYQMSALSSNSDYGYCDYDNIGSVSISEEGEHSLNKKADAHKKEVKIGKAAPGFIAAVIPQIEKICAYLEDYTLINKIAEMKNYGEDIAVWRISGGGFSKVGDPSTISLYALAGLNEPVRNKANKSFEDKNAALINTALRNKANIKKLLRAQPVPSTFWNFLLMCVFIVMVSIVTIVIMYLIFINLFDNLIQETRMIYYQMDICRDVMEASSTTLQLVSVNEGILDINNTYPRRPPEGGLVKWTGNNLNTLMHSIKADASAMQSSPYEALTVQLYDTLINYTNNGTNTKFINIPYILGYQLVVSEIKNISRFTSASDYTYKSPSIATLLYNTQNSLYRYSLDSTSTFMSNMVDLYNNQLKQSQLMFVILTCIFALLVFVQAPTSYALNSIVTSQVDIFLRLPIKFCAKLAKNANAFICKMENKKYGIEEGDFQSALSDAENYNRIQKDHIQEETEYEPLIKNRESKRTRSFFKTLWMRLEFLWRIILAFAVPALIMTIMYVSALKHNNFMYQILKLTNYTVRLDMTLSVSDALNRVYYFDRSAVSYVNSVITKTVFYQDGRIYDISNTLYQQMKESAKSLNGEHAKNLETFVFADMGVTGNPLFSADPVAQKGCLAVVGEFLWLSKYLQLENKDPSTRKTVFNTPEYVRIVELYYDFLHPGLQYMYNSLMAELTTQNDKIVLSLRIEMALTVILSLLIFFVMWLPHVKARKKELVKLRLLLTFLPAKVIGKVPALRSYFAKLLFKQKD